MFRFGRSGLELFNFSEGEVLFCDDVFVGFVFIILFLFFLERSICYWNKSRFGLAFCVWSYCVFCLDIKVLLCDAVLSFLFCYVCFNKC